MVDRAPGQAYRMPAELRQELGQPFGPVVQSGELPALTRGKTVIAVGDVVSLALKEHGIAPKLFVCDYQTQRGGESEMYRRELGSWGESERKVRNPAGEITREAWLAVREALASPHVPERLVVAGEEDLLGIPCFLEAPVGAIVLYGMPGRGVVVVTVDLPFKQRVEALLDRFVTSKAKPARKAHGS